MLYFNNVYFMNLLKIIFIYYQSFIMRLSVVYVLLLKFKYVYWKLNFFYRKILIMKFQFYIYIIRFENFIYLG